MTRLIRFAFQQFYTTFAWSYDAIAAIVSFGEWQAWGRAALAFVPDGARVLEVAHGPGHLHQTMRQRGMDVMSIDRSWQMARMLQHLLQANAQRAAHQPTQQACADAGRLPFADEAFDCVISTFPAEFIFTQDTLRDVQRVLAADGCLVIVPNAVFCADDVVTRAIKLAYRLTGQNAINSTIIRDRFSNAGFTFQEHTVKTRRAEVTVWVCHKSTCGLFVMKPSSRYYSTPVSACRSCAR